MGDSGTNVRKYIQQFREPPSGCMPNSYEAGATPLYADKTTFQQCTDVGDLRCEYDFRIPEKVPPEEASERYSARRSSG